MPEKLPELLVEKIRRLDLKPNSGYARLATLILGGFFNIPVSSSAIILAMRAKFGDRWSSNYPHKYTDKFLKADILQAIKTKASRYWVIATIPRDKALRQTQERMKIREIEDELFSVPLLMKLQKDFQYELDELHAVFGMHGNATAFLLRKILEKLIIIVFGKIGKDALLEDKAKKGRWIGLEAMIETAAREKIHGVPILLPKTVSEIKGIKFLRDAATHNPLVNIDTKTILPEIQFIIAAYEELAKRL